MRLWENAPTILVVDDDEIMRQFLRTLLVKQDYQVVVVEHGGLALEWLEANPQPDLMILDIQTPVLTGWQVLDRMRTVPRLAAVPVMVVSGLPVLGYAQQYANVCGVLYKPFQVAELLSSIQRCTRP